MKLHERAVLITGAAGGIGAALARRFARERPRGVVVTDIVRSRAERVAQQVRELGGPALAVGADVSDADQVADLVAAAEASFGAVDVVVSNAGIATGAGIFAGPQPWANSWSVNVMAHVHLAQAVLPAMAARRSGYFVITASAAGLLGLPGDAPYTVTKHAAVGLAEWLAMTYRRKGIGVSALCPLGVRTDLLMAGLAAGHPASKAVANYAPIIEPDEVAEATLRGIADERFLILPHAEVHDLHVKKVSDPDGWLAEQGEGR
jgi:NAD(P)-dependent dehydrogenase (short-subunit alcohol dehydrogenase family)